MTTARIWVRILAYSSGLGIVGKLGQFVALTYLATVLLPEEFGRFSIAQYLIAGIASIVSSSYSIACNKTAAALVSSEHALSVFSVMRVLLRRFALHLVMITMTITVLMPILYSVIAGTGIELWMFAISAAMVSIVISDMFVGTIAGLGGIRLSAVLDASRALFSGLFAVLLASSFGYVGGAFGLVFFDLVLALTVVVASVCRKKNSEAIGIEVHDSQALVLSGITSNGSTQIAAWATLWVIQTFFGLGAVGTFAVANRFATLVIIIPSFLSKNMLGELTRLMSSGVGTKARRAVVVYSIGTALIAILTAGIAFTLVASGFDGLKDAYSGVMAVLGVLLSAAVLRAIATGLGVVCVAQGRLRVWIWSDIVGMGVTLAMLGITLALSAELPVVLLATVLGACACFVIRFVAVETQSKVRV